jgi:hypothetical protein
MPRIVAIVIIVAVVLIEVGCLRRAPRLGPVACPIEPTSRPPAGAVGGPVRIDGPPPTQIFTGPYTLVLDGHIEAVSRDSADTVAIAQAFGRIDPKTIKSLEVIRRPMAAQQYPGAIGDVFHVTRCYPSISRGDRPNVR